MNNTNLRSILIPIDFMPASECAVEYGIYLAKLFSADIFLLHILEGIHTYPSDWFNNKNQATDNELIRKKVSEKLNEYTKNITEKYGVPLKGILSTGRPAHKITEIVAEHDIDLIVMGTHGASGFEEFFVGHTTHKVINISPCPVITIREGFKLSEIKSIVLPIDESLHSRQKVNNVLAIASRCKALVHVLGIIQGSNKSDMDKFNIKINTVEKAIKKVGLTCIRKVVKGNHVAMEAMNYAEKVNADLLAIMTDHESNMTGTFMGGFAQQIVNHSKVPVLSIKPVVGFTSYPL